MTCDLDRKCFVTYETRFGGRLDATAGLAVLIASLGKHMPDIPLFVFHTKPCDHLKKFANKHGPTCVFKQVDDVKYVSWYGKPNAILTAFDSGYERVCWLDADMVFTRDCTEMLFPIESAVLRTAQIPNALNCIPERHAALFGAEPSFSLDTSIGSAVVSVSQRHRTIIEKWSKTMEEKTDIINQNRYLFGGDQEVLEAVIMNTRDINLFISTIKNDIEHLHCSRGGIRKLLRVIFAEIPPIVHASPYKPWWPLDRSFEHWARAFLECIPYTIEARRYRNALNQLDGHAFAYWLSVYTVRSEYAFYFHLGPLRVL